MRADTENSLQSDSISSVRKEAAQAVVTPQDKQEYTDEKNLGII